MAMKQYQSRSIKGAFGKVRKVVLRAEQMAMNKTVVSTRGKVIDFIRIVYNIKKKDLLKISRIKKLMRKGNNTSVQILFDEEPITLAKFGGKWKRATGRKGKKTLTAGASAEIKKGQRKIFPGTFIATMRSGHTGIFKRIEGSATSGGKEKLKQYWGASGGQLFASTKAWKFMKEFFHSELKKQMKIAIKYLNVKK